MTEVRTLHRACGYHWDRAANVLLNKLIDLHGADGRVPHGCKVFADYCDRIDAYDAD